MSSLIKKIKDKLDYLISGRVMDDTTVDEYERVKHVTDGFMKSFLSYFVPAVILGKGKVSIATIRRGLALGVFVSGVRAVNHFIAGLAKDGDSDLHDFVKKYHLWIAGFVSSLIAMVIDGDIHMSYIFLFWCFIRAARCFVPHYEYGSVGVMMLSTTWILPTWIMMPNLLSPTYKRFLDIHGGRSQECYQQLRVFASENMCHALHPETGDTAMGCATFLSNFFVRALRRAFKLYLPVHVITFLFSGKWRFDYLAENMFKSCLFLATYCTSAWTIACISQRIASMRPSHMYFYALFPGLSVLFERPKRRSELAAYVCTYALDSVYRTLISNKIIKESVLLNAVILAISAGTIVQYNDQQPAMLMKWLFKFVKQ
eukprot:TRINITY_DN7046_c0_g1_i1.p1 TRINITY_DN7046_c0_g1~~TRINITY_DN7046_c0_g1_i1.p1  ORF type:complete len:372 (+),score=38.67 TRINITY_DN7046_c0_g1_i1:58-1173(+)